jgi:hypothetical protein
LDEEVGVTGIEHLEELGQQQLERHEILDAPWHPVRGRLRAPCSEGNGIGQSRRGAADRSERQPVEAIAPVPVVRMQARNRSQKHPLVALCEGPARPDAIRHVAH